MVYSISIKPEALSHLEADAEETHQCTLQSDTVRPWATARASARLPDLRKIRELPIRSHGRRGGIPSARQRQNTLTFIRSRSGPLTHSLLPNADPGHSGAETLRRVGRLAVISIRRVTSRRLILRSFNGSSRLCWCLARDPCQARRRRLFSRFTAVTLRRAGAILGGRGLSVKRRHCTRKWEILDQV